MAREPTTLLLRRARDAGVSISRTPKGALALEIPPDAETLAATLCEREQHLTALFDWRQAPVAQPAPCLLCQRPAMLRDPADHLPGTEPISIGHPTDTTEPPWDMYVRYQDPDGTAYGVATLPHPDRITARPGDTEGAAIGVATTISHTGHAHGVFDPYDPGPPLAQGPLRLDGGAYPSVACGAAPGVTVRAARLPDGTVIAIWGLDAVLDREITLTA